MSSERTANRRFPQEMYRNDTIPRRPACVVFGMILAWNEERSPPHPEIPMEKSKSIGNLREIYSRLYYNFIAILGTHAFDRLVYLV